MAEIQEVHSHPGIRGRKNKNTAIPQPASQPACTRVVQKEAPISVSVVPTIETKSIKPEKQRQAIEKIDVSEFVTCILVNFKTYNLVKIALTTFIKFYPGVMIYLIDNGSHDKSTQYIKRCGKNIDNVQSILYDNNIGHGPAMHRAIMVCETDYIFTLDSDCIVRKGGFLERMIKRMRSDRSIYSLGWLRYVDRVTGVSMGETPRSLRYIHPSAALYDRKKYLVLPPFSHSGAPCTLNMLGAKRAGYKVYSFPISNYIEHLIAGTRRMYKGKWNPKTNEKPGSWNKDTHLPI